MNAIATRPMLRELNSLGLKNKSLKLDFLQSLEKATQTRVASILELDWINKMIIDNHGRDSLNFDEIEINECLEVWDIAKKYADLIEKNFPALKVTQLFHETQYSKMDLLENQRTKKIGEFPANKTHIDTQFFFEDEAINGEIVAKIDLWIPDVSPSQCISFEISIDTIHSIQANMDILALKNNVENKNAGKLMQAQLETNVLKYTDRMTGLYNGLFVEQSLTQAENEYSYIFIDVSGFKEINDKNGHDIWDKALIEVANYLQKSCRIEDKVCRMWWDEFAILFKWDNENHIKNLISRLKNNQISVQNNQNESVDIDLKYWYGVKNYQSEDYMDLVKIANAMLNEKKDKKGAAYRFKSLLLSGDEETRIYSFWHIIQDPKCLDYMLQSILQEPSTQVFLDWFLDLLQKFKSWELWEISQSSSDSINNFIHESSKLDKIAA